MKLSISKKVLIVDDNRDISECLKELLIHYKFEVAIADDALEALDLISDNNFCAIISDLEMPIINGIDFFKRVRSLDLTIPFVLMSGNHYKYQMELNDLNGLLIINKPFRDMSPILEYINS